TPWRSGSSGGSFKNRAPPPPASTTGRPPSSGLIPFLFASFRFSITIPREYRCRAGGRRSSAWRAAIMGLMQRLFQLRFRSRMKHFAGMAGPTPSYPLGTSWDFRKGQPWDVCAAYEKEYGGVTLIWEGGTPVVVLSDAELIREVLITKHQDYWKDAPGPAFRP